MDIPFLAQFDAPGEFASGTTDPSEAPDAAASTKPGDRTDGHYVSTSPDSKPDWMLVDWDT